MKISDVIRGLQEVLEQEGDLGVYHSLDDDKDGYGRIWEAPSVCYMCDKYITYGENEKSVDVEKICTIN